jgi:chemotaxis family two-component system sensor kinase Cph1
LETGGTSRTDYLPEGVVCDITLPAEAIAKLEPAPAASAAYPPADTVAVHKGGPRRILVVEDSALVVMLIEDVFEDLGWELVGPASRLGIACEMAAHETYDAALLDINLDGEMSWDVAAIVEARGIPFAFSTGYDGAAVLPKRFRNAAIISKPFQIDDLTSLLREMAE